MNGKLVSIIIPVYNVEMYLEQCINSVIYQTYKNIEVILVDDGSTDDSGTICDHFAEKDNRVTVIHKNNGGPSSARNAGIEICKGEFIYFLDSDDYIAEDTITKYVQYLEQFGADVMQGSVRYFSDNEADQTAINRDSLQVELFHTEQALKMMMLDYKLCHNAAGSLYKAKLFDKIRFPEGVLYEDLATTFYVMKEAGKILYCDDKRYYYRRREGSIMNSPVKEKNMVLLDVVDRVMGDMKDFSSSLEQAALRKQVVTYLKMYSSILYSGKNAFPKEQDRINRFVKQNGMKFLFSDCVRFKDKVKVIFFLMGRLPFSLVYRLSDSMR